MPDLSELPVEERGTHVEGNPKSVLPSDVYTSKDKDSNKVGDKKKAAKDKGDKKGKQKRKVDEEDDEDEYDFDDDQEQDKRTRSNSKKSKTVKSNKMEVENIKPDAKGSSLNKNVGTKSKKEQKHEEDRCQNDCCKKQMVTDFLDEIIHDKPTKRVKLSKKENLKREMIQEHKGALPEEIKLNSDAIDKSCGGEEIPTDLLDSEVMTIGTSTCVSEGANRARQRLNKLKLPPISPLASVNFKQAKPSKKQK